MTPPEPQITSLLLNGCEYARDCGRWCNEATKALCVARKRVVGALEQAKREGMELAAIIAESHREGDQYGTLPGTSSAGTEIAASIRSKAAVLGGPLPREAAGMSGDESTSIPKAEWHKEPPMIDDGPVPRLVGGE